MDPRLAQPDRRPISTSRTLLFSVGVVLVLLALLEVAVRARAWMRYGAAEAGMVDSMLVPDPTTGNVVPRAGFQQRSQKLSISINSLGFRGDEFTIDKPPRTIRIATVGASTTFCGEVPNDATWPARLQTLLQRAHPEVAIQVINAGVPGYVAAQSLANVRHRVLPLKPDLVIYYEANNDMAYDTRSLAVAQGVTAASRSRLSQTLSTYSLLYDLVQKNARIMLARNATDAKLSGLPADLPARYVKTLDEMRTLTAEHGVDFLLSTFIVKYRRDQPRATQIENASVAFFYMPWMTIDHLLDGIDLYNKALLEFAQAQGVPIVDDRESVPGDERHFVDWAHFSGEGTAKMAQRFARFLEEQGLMRKLIARTSG
jgi:lysophospholipase L1-like esterase